MIQKKHLVVSGCTMIATALIFVFALTQYPCTCRKSAVKEQLKNIFSGQRTFHLSHGRYGDIGTTLYPGDTAPELQIEIAPTLLYTLSITADSTGYTCTATGNIDDDATLSILAVDATGHLCIVSDDVGG